MPQGLDTQLSRGSSPTCWRSSSRSADHPGRGDILPHNVAQQEEMMQGTRSLGPTTWCWPWRWPFDGPAGPGSFRPQAGWSDRVPRVDGARAIISSGPGGDKPATRGRRRPGTWPRRLRAEGGQARRRRLGPRRDVQGQARAEAGRPGRCRHPRPAYPGERATLLDGTLFVESPASYVWVWDLEITTSTPPEQRVITEAGSHPTPPGHVSPTGSTSATRTPPR